MSNCHVIKSCLELYEHLLTDVCTVFPSLVLESQRDLIRLHDSATSRGVQVFFVDLPALAKHLDRCLAEGVYSPSNLPLSKPENRSVVIPKLFRGLYLHIFDRRTGLMLEDVSIEAIRLLRQCLLVLKKFKITCSDERISATVADFLVDEHDLPTPPEFWGGYGAADFSTEHATSTFVDLRRSGLISLSVDRCKMLDIVAGIITSELGHYDPSEWSHRHGPGAISQSTKKGNKYDWYNWSSALESVFPIADTGYHSHSSWALSVSPKEAYQEPDPANSRLVSVLLKEDEIGVLTPYEPMSRLITVPKTFKGPRLIAAEPSEQMFCQQNLWHYFDTRMRRSPLGHFVRFRDQTQNRDLALLGSVDGKLATVDLSAASDRVSCCVVGSAFRANPRLVEALRATRTRQVKMLDGSICQLKKFSTAGSACTFPVETMIFLAIALASHCFKHRIKPSVRTLSRLRGALTVYGDDMIVPIEDLDELKLFLKDLFFKVNVGKTFGTGLFRESCGVDAYAGQKVTPTYMRTFDFDSPESLASIVATHNNFLTEGYKSVANYLACRIGSRVDRVAPGSTVFGLMNHSVPNILGRKLRWNGDLQVVQVWHSQLQTRIDRTPTNDDSGIFQYLTENPSPFDGWQHGFDQRPTSRVVRRWVDLEKVYPGI